MQSVADWLSNIIRICNKKVGTPYERCHNLFEEAIVDCRAKLGPYFGTVCNITHLVKTICYALKPLDFICKAIDYVEDTVVSEVKKSTLKFIKIILKL